MVCVLSRTNPPTRSPNSFRFRTSARPHILHYFGANKPFRIRTYRYPSCNSFRIRTYKNTGGVPHTSASSSLPRSNAPRGAFIPSALTRLRIRPVATGMYPSLRRICSNAVRYVRFHALEEKQSADQHHADTNRRCGHRNSRRLPVSGQRPTESVNDPCHGI